MGLLNSYRHFLQDVYSYNFNWSDSGCSIMWPYVVQEAQALQQLGAVQRQEVLGGRHRQVPVQVRVHDGGVACVLVSEWWLLGTQVVTSLMYQVSF